MRVQLAQQAQEILGQSDVVMITERVDDVAPRVPVQPVKTGITPPLAIPFREQAGEKGPIRRAGRLHERQ